MKQYKSQDDNNFNILNKDKISDALTNNGFEQSHTGRGVLLCTMASNLLIYSQDKCYSIHTTDKQ